MHIFVYLCKKRTPFNGFCLLLPPAKTNKKMNKKLITLALAAITAMTAMQVNCFNTFIVSSVFES